MTQTSRAKLFSAALVGLIGLAGPAAAQVAPSYTLVDLGTLATGTNSMAEGISPTNMVVGWSDIAGGFHQAVAWVGTTPVNLGMLPGDTQSEARYANATGTIVGFSTNGTNGDGTADKAVTFSLSSAPVNLNIGTSITQPATGPALTNSRAEYISPTGEIVGHAFSGDFNNLQPTDGIRGFYRNAAGTSVTRLDPPSGTTNYPADAVLSYGINASSQVFGQADPGGATPGYRGSRWSVPSGAAATPSTTYPTASGNPLLTDYLGTQGNNANRIVGTATDLGSNSQAFASDGTTSTLLNTLGGTAGNAFSINNALTNVIVGSSSNASGSLLATAWNWSSTAGATPNPTAINLNTLLGTSNSEGMVLIQANGVNDNGFIVGYGIVNGNEHAFELIPVAVPEPGTLALCGIGLGGLAVRAWRRRRAG